MNKYYWIIGAVIIVFVIAIFLQQNSQPIACTQEAKICPDGSAVGRIPPDCRFAPCPSCTCPEGYILEGDVCNPECYYSTPKCLAPSIMCNATNNQTTDELCRASGGAVTTQLCCKSASDFPNTCLIGACGCSPDNSKEVKVCDCGEGKCWDSTKQACVTR
jgi:hypothetical protein